MSYGYIKSLDSASYGRYIQKLQSVGLDECPYDLPADKWINNPTQWPEVQYPDIYSYLIETPGIYTKKAMKNFKSLEAHRQFTAGWVQTVFHLKPSHSKTLVLKATVRPSWKVNDEPHSPWIAVDPDGTVLTAHCNCKAGLGESCSHIASLLFKVEAAVRNGYTKVACTSEPCKWNQCFVKKIQPSTISRISFYKDEVKDRLKKCMKKRKCYAPSTESQKSQFVKDLADSGTSKPVGLSLFKETYTLFSFKESEPVKRLPMSMKSLFSDSNTGLTTIELHAKCQNIKQTMKVTRAEVDYLEETTIKQSESPVWHEQRIGRVTASVTHSVLHTKIDAPAPSIIKKICYPEKRHLNTPAVLWGRDNENEAIKNFTDAVTQGHTECKVEKTGMRICEDKPFIGASPDAVVKCTCHGKGVVEVKCPYKYKDSTIAEILASKDSCLNQLLELKHGHPYFSQVQQQMLVFQCDLCHFVLWTTKQCVITTVLRDNNFLTDLISKVENFWTRHCLPELLTHKMVQAQQSVLLIPGANECIAHCVCGKPDEVSDMIGCDNANCKYKWFHFTCVNIKRPPKGSWYCKDCRRNK